MANLFCIVGQDARQQAAGETLREAGCQIAGTECAGQAGYLLLPMSCTPATPGVLTALHRAMPGTLVLGGRVGLELRQEADRLGLPVIDYYDRPELACLNAVPTAEGCLCLLMQLRERTIWESAFLVLGYGRIGRAVARRLVALGGLVTVAVRNPEQRASARCAGCRAAPLEGLERILPRFGVVINTIPAPVLRRQELQRMPAGGLIIDLASQPGGTDFAAAKELGIRAEHALSLPAKCAPQTAGTLIAQTVLAILQERGERC